MIGVDRYLKKRIEDVTFLNEKKRIGHNPGLTNEKNKSASSADLKNWGGADRVGIQGSIENKGGKNSSLVSRVGLRG